MYGYESSEEQQPMTYLRGYPIYAAHLIVVVFVASMILTSLIGFAQRTNLLEPLVFASSEVWRGEVWRIFTYGLVNEPSLRFVIDMFMMVWFGRELEKFFGRTAFLTFFAMLYVISPVVLTLVGLSTPTFLVGERGALAIFVGFATLYPNVPVFFSILAKWAALILVGIFTLMAMSRHDYAELFSLWATTAFAFGFVRYRQGRINLPRINWFSRKPKLRVLPDPEPRAKRATVVAPAEDPMAEVDALLDKIAQSGIASLTSKERAKLDAAQASLQRKKSGRS